MGNLTPPSKIDIKGKNTTCGRRSRAILSSWQYATSTSLGMANLALKLAKATRYQEDGRNPFLVIEYKKKTE